jgi:predicted enzyme related to lactoylglutathione lyase
MPPSNFYGTAFGWRFTDYAPAYAGIQALEGDGEVGGLSLGQTVEPGRFSRSDQGEC